jgi:hypothetical protein
MGFRGGYSDLRRANGDYEVTVRVNASTERSTALAYMQRRAGELCAKGYDVIDQPTDHASGGADADDDDHPHVVAVVRCKGQHPDTAASDVAGDAQPAAASRRTIAGEHPMFCAGKMNDASVGPCFIEQFTCEDERAKLGKARYAECGERTAAACFTANGVLDRKVRTLCFVSVKDCEAKRAAKTSDPDYSGVSTECSIFRVAGTPQ